MLVLLGLGVLGLGVCATTASGTPVAYVSLPTAANGSATIPTGSSYTSNLGYAFKTGLSVPFDIDWVKFELTSSTASGTGTF
jgi:hypothetical protein